MPDLFLPRSRPWHLTTAAEGGLKSAPASRLRGAVPHQLSSYASSSLARFVCSWRTVTGKPDITHATPFIVTHPGIDLSSSPHSVDPACRSRCNLEAECFCAISILILCGL